VTTILAFVFVIGVLVFVHELGHFLAARRIGVRVLKFSLGFGPRLVGFTRGDTEYCVSIIPLGGYVKMAGENPEDPRSGHDDEFLSKTKWQRFQILIMGPVMNLVLAVIVLAVVLAQGAQVPAYLSKPPVVGAVEKGSGAEKGGIQPEDRLLTIGGESVATWRDAQQAVGMRPSRDIVITLDRGGRTVTVTAKSTADRYEVGDIGVLPDTSPHVRSVNAGEPADRAGVKVGDVLLQVNGQHVVNATRLKDALALQKGKAVDLVYARGGERRQTSVTPDAQTGMIGVGLTMELQSFTPTPLEAVRMSVVQNWEQSGAIFKTLVGLFTGQTSVRQLQGPVGIAQLSGESARAGWVELLALMAMISLNLGILNLMPVPVLDGGHILIMALEGVARRDFSMAVKEKMLLAGFAVLMVLMVTVIYNDLTRISWIARFMPWRS
jgi:regulator of sigma E protease